MEEHFLVCDQAKIRCPYLDCPRVETYAWISKHYESCPHKKFYCWTCNSPRTERGPHFCVAELQHSLLRVQRCLEHGNFDSQYVLDHTDLGEPGNPVFKSFKTPIGYAEALRRMIRFTIHSNLEEVAKKEEHDWRPMKEWRKSQDAELRGFDEVDGSDSSSELHVPGSY